MSEQISANEGRTATVAKALHDTRDHIAEQLYGKQCHLLKIGRDRSEY
jgi:hypothetical protein